MIIARQSTARTVMIGPVLDADGVAVTDCVVADFEGSVNGGDPAALNGSATLTHRGVGFYSLALTATDLGTVGSFEVSINDTTNGCAIKEITVIEEAVYDALFAASAVGPLLANSNGSGLTEAGGDGDHLTAINLPNQTMDIVGNITGNLSGSVGSVTGAVGSVTGNVGGNVAGSVGSLATQAKADVNAEADAAIADAALATAANLATVAGYLDTEIAAILADTNELQTDWANGGRLDLLIDAILADTGTDGVVISAATANAIADALLDRAAGVETNRTPRQALRLILAALVGKLSGAATSTVTIRDTNDGVNRVVATCDSDGNRSAVTLDAS